MNIIDWKSPQQRDKEYTELRVYLMQSRWSHFITLNLNLGFKNDNLKTLKRIDDIALEFHRELDKNLYGYNYFKLKKSDYKYRSEFYGFIENVNSNLHIHLFANISPSGRIPITEAVQIALEHQFPAATTDVQALKSSQERDIASRYILKSFRTLDCHPYKFLSPEKKKKA